MITYTAIVLFVIAFAVGLRNVCEPGWRFSPHSRKCYKFFNRSSAWAHAEFNCRYLGGHHLSVHSMKENIFAKEIARKAPVIWLGNAQFKNSSKYEWSDHTPYNFEGWKNGRRPKYNKAQPCVKMNTTDGTWFQSCCRIVAPYICQKEPRQQVASKLNGKIGKVSEIKKNSILNRRWRFLA